MEPESNPAARRAPDRRRLRTAGIALALTALLAGGLRLYRLDEQSLTTDEYATFIFAPDAPRSAYVALDRFRLPDNQPVYSGVLHLWMRLTGGSLHAARLMSVFAGVASCLLVYAVTRGAFHAWTAVFAALLYALSPFHLFHDQGIRPYALFMMLSGLSLLTARPLLREKPGARAILASIGVNVLLIYTQILAGALLVAQGLVLLVWWRRAPARLACWALPQIVLALPAYFMMTLPDADPLYAIPWSRIFGNIFGPDTIHFSNELLLGQGVWHGLPGLTVWLRTHLPQLGAILVALIVLVWTGTLFALVRRRPPEQHDSAPGAAEARTRFGFQMMLVSVSVAPALFLGFLSLVVEPMPMPRYMLFMSFGRYALVGGGLAMLRQPALRWLLFTALVGILALHLFVYLPAGARTESRAAAARIESEGRPENPVVVSAYPDLFYIHMPMRIDVPHALASMFAFHAGPDIRVQCAHSALGLAEAAARALGPSEDGGRNPAAWLVVYRMFRHGPLEELERELAGRDLEFERWDYYAGEGITLYRVTGAPGPEPPLDAAELEVWRDFLRNWGVLEPQGTRESEVLRALRLSLNHAHHVPASGKDYVTMALLLGKHATDAAASFANAGLERWPGHAALYLVRGYLRLLRGMNKDALADLESARQRLPGSVLAPLASLIDLTVAGRFQEALDHFEEMQRLSGGLFDSLFSKALRAAQSRATGGRSEATDTLTILSDNT